jgi:hypothetical protein
MDLDAMQEAARKAMSDRRAAMFGPMYHLAQHTPASRHGGRREGPLISVRDCNECGVPVTNADAHFGFHMKIDNIDQRANAQGHHH